MPIVHYPEVVFQDPPHTPRFINLAGNRYSRLLVLGYAGAVKKRGRWYCQCDCGNLAIIIGKELRKGKTVSCGCYNTEKRIKHGLSLSNGKQSPIYAAWHDMMRRCYQSGHKAFYRYGGRGITVCERWHTIETFVSDMGSKPSAHHSLDRIDNNKGYSPENCRWATNKEQQRNREYIKQVAFRGESKSISEWCEILGLTFQVAWRRIRVYGWSVDDAFLLPTKHRGPNKTRS